MELPVQFAELMKNLLGNEYEDYLASYANPRLYGLRVNTNKISCEEFEKISPFHLKKIPWIPNGYYYGEEESPAKHPYYFAGLYYLQEPSAMTPASLLPIEEGDRVLDLCAAPGGKSTELGAKLRGTGVLVANDISVSRAKGLLKNIELFGISNSLIVSETPEKLEQYFTGYFDKILIDAPCSGEGMFRKDPAMIKSWIEKGPEFYAEIQKGIILSAARMLKPGGMMLFSTCTFSPVENEGTIAYLLENCSGFSIMELPQYEGFSHGLGGGEFEKCVRIWPHKAQGEGHFIALLKKAEEDGVTASHIGENRDDKVLYTETKHAKNKKDRPDKNQKKRGRSVSGEDDPDSGLQELENFITDAGINREGRILKVHEGNAYLVPEGTEGIRGLRFLRTGLSLGELKKNRFEPSQALAMSFMKERYPNTVDLPVSDQRVIRYLKGETIELEDITDQKASGWRLVCVDGYPLGWGKLTSCSLKNKYYPGWRWQI